MGKMISRIIDQIEPIRAVLSVDRQTFHIIPTWQDMDRLTDILSGDDYVTIYAGKPIVDLIEKSCLHPSQMILNCQ